jgi:hypothetical protein
MAPLPLTSSACSDQTAPYSIGLECLLAPPVFTDGTGRVLLLYQQLVESGFDNRVMTGA